VVEAELKYDSARDVLCGVRGFGTQPRMLLFQWNGVILDLMVWYRGKRSCSVHGRVTEVPMRSPVVGALATTAGSEAVTDKFGEFTLVLGEESAPRQVCVRTSSADVVCPLPDPP
jgi:hypothetical protein